MFDRIFNDIKRKEHNKHITITTTNNIPNVLINADENRLVQVVSNMVDNAAFSNTSGFTTAILNSGNNVLIQSSVFVNVIFK